MNEVRQRIVREARTWLGTPYRHQQATRGKYTDCIGIVYEVGLALGLLQSIENYPDLAAKYKGYNRFSAGGSLLSACNIMLQPIAIEALRPGDVFLMEFNREPQHAGFIGDYIHGGLSLIHAYAPMRRVVESRLDDGFMSKIVGAYMFPALETA